MHRIASLPTEEPSENLALIEQPHAPILFLTTAASDVSTLAYVLQDKKAIRQRYEIRAIHLKSLKHNAQIDHYISTTGSKAKIIIVRFLGSRSAWSYGFEQLVDWSTKDKITRKLIILSGTEEDEVELNGMSDINFEISRKLGKLLRVGGFENMQIFLNIIYNYIENKIVNINDFSVKKIEDPYLWDWKKGNGNKVGIIFYSSMLNSGDTEYAQNLLTLLREEGINPRAIWVSSLKKDYVQKRILTLFKHENLNCIITATSFASVNFEDSSDGSQIWDKLNVPIFQILTSNKQKKEWEQSSRGIDAIDLSMQVVMPELDGRITTKIAAFKEKIEDDLSLYSPIYKLKADNKNLSWIVSFTSSWISLQKAQKKDVKAILILSNYPIRDGRIANGVGLDTPASILSILKLLKNEGYYLGDDSLPKEPKELMRLILSNRTNSQETRSNTPLAYLSLDQYLKYWEGLSEEVKEKVVKSWQRPHESKELEKNGFAIHGVQFGNIVLLIQPSRGHTEDNIDDIHSPTLAPPHRYLAQYHWITNHFKANLILHMGKHGTAEWLPGKSVGLSPNCFPQIIIPPLPYFYTFIVNDPGEGSQAKRRSHTTILDHLTPPLARSGLTNDLMEVECLLDEYHEAKILDSSRMNIIKAKLDKLIKELNLTNIFPYSSNENLSLNKENLYNKIEGYLCELKESQIRSGLHVYGSLPSKLKLIELTLSIFLPPSLNTMGITQTLASHLDIDIDPWSDAEEDEIEKSDLDKISYLTITKMRIKGDFINWITNQAQHIVAFYLIKAEAIDGPNQSNLIIDELQYFIDEDTINPSINHLTNNIIPKILASPKREMLAVKNSFKGLRIPSGPSGAPTRGDSDVLPTGKNFYSVDLRSLPTESAWDLGRRSAELITELYVLENGANLTHLALSVWATSTMRNGGEDIAQLLALIGIQPVWDRVTRRLIDIEVIPLNILNRPRVDVTLRISGLFRDAFPNLIGLINKAQAKIRSLNEPAELNPYAFANRNGEPIARVYGSSPEGYGTGIQEFISLSSWDSQEELANCFIEHSKWQYNDANEPVSNKKELEQTLKNISVVMHNQDNREHDLLDSDDYYQFHGGLSNAVKKVSGSQPQLYFGDNSRHNRPKVHKLQKEIDKVIRSRLLNPKWIEGIKEHGYKGAFEMSASLDYLFAYDATTDVVSDWSYSSILKVWLKDEDTLKFFMNENPWVLRDISERFLEAANRCMWNANDEELNLLQEIVLLSDKNIEEFNF